MAIIDAHIHYGDSAPEFLDLLRDLDLTLLNISLVHRPDEDWRAQSDIYRSLADNWPGRFAWCTTFDLPRFDDPKYVDKVIAGLDRDFEAGAVACKVWKNIGMDVKTPDGSFMMVDDPLFSPIFEHIAARGRTLLMHIAEPLACWRPLDPADPHYGYYSRNPQWHMYGKPEFPSHERLIAARDRVVEQHPNLRIVAAHLASLEYDVGAVAHRLDRYPNLVVDISARLADLAHQDSATVRDFFVRYQDRILFGTDVVMRTKPSQMPPLSRAEEVEKLREIYEVHNAYLESSSSVTVRNHETTGLGLPNAVLDKVRFLNAIQWYPGILPAASHGKPHSQ